MQSVGQRNRGGGPLELRGLLLRGRDGTGQGHGVRRRRHQKSHCDRSTCQRLDPTVTHGATSHPYLDGRSGHDPLAPRCVPKGSQGGARSQRVALERVARVGATIGSPLGRPRTYDATSSVLTSNSPAHRGPPQRLPWGCEAQAASTSWGRDRLDRAVRLFVDPGLGRFHDFRAARPDARATVRDRRRHRRCPHPQQPLDPSPG